MDSPLNHDHGSQQPDIPREYAGKWVAWNSQGTEIVASGDTLTACHEDAEQKEVQKPRFEKIPELDVRTIGALR